MTGLLFFDEIHFIQYIEGPEDHLHRLYEHLLIDQRHENMETLVLAQSSEHRRFASWNMAYVEFQDELHDIPKLRRLRSAAALFAFEELLTRVTATKYARTSA